VGQGYVRWSRTIFSLCNAWAATKRQRYSTARWDYIALERRIRLYETQQDKIWAELGFRSIRPSRLSKSDIVFIRLAKPWRSVVLLISRTLHNIVQILCYKLKKNCTNKNQEVLTKITYLNITNVVPPKQLLKISFFSRLQIANTINLSILTILFDRKLLLYRITIFTNTTIDF